ncbi:MAG: tyrosine-type recombinase/integrase [Hyphomicrobium sp.]|jgi:integrase|nr:tyrosine-type recombinase/integrase [Hyphomicrobium sp.]
MSQKQPFTPADIAIIRAALTRRASDRDTALFEVAISSGLRASDLVTLRVADVVGGQDRIRMTGTKRQQKTGKVVSFNLSDAARVALSPVVDGKASDAYVFEGKQSGEHVSDQTFRALCKWMADDVLGKDRNDYAAHSTRRTLGTHIYKQTGDVATVARLLGHTNTGATLAYLGVTTDDALATARKLAL